MNRLLLLICCLLCAAAQAQISSTPVSNTLDAYWSVPLTADQRQFTTLARSDVSIPDPSSPLNSVALQQNGSGNQASLRIAAGGQNRLDVNQSSNGNGVDAYLSGSNNSLILSQTGGGNQINLGLDGNNNRFMLTQDGGDRLNLGGLQKNGTRLEIAQGSGSNTLTLDNTNPFIDPLSKGIPNLRIEQSGGASVQIQQGRVIGN